MDVGGDLTLQWVEEVGNVIHEEVICGLDGGLEVPTEEVVEEVAVEETVESTPQDGNNMGDSEILLVPQSNDMESIYVIPQDQGHDYLNIQVTEEVITDSWDRAGPDDGIEVPETKVSHDNLLEYDDMEIPLPIDQDSYTNTRPYPCDFCSRRFRKKANLMNHMVAHQTDRPHGCNLCGARYVRKCDLVNHLKIHAYAPSRDGLDDDMHDEDPLATEEDEPSNKRGRKRAQTGAGRKRKLPGAGGPGRKRNTDASRMSSSTARWTDQMVPVSNEPQSPRWPVTDVSKPYVCQFCGVGFAREKALASHARIHGGDSPFECTSCNEMFWDINSLQEHMRIKHGLGLIGQEEMEQDNNISYLADDRIGEYYCDTCGLVFHRPDLLKRHRRTHVKPEMDLGEGSSQHHVCNVCGEWFTEALALLAHAELHASRSPSRRCLLCGERCRDDAEVADHVREMHAEDAPPNTCVLCGKTCKDKKSLLKHSWIHNTDKTFACTKCGKRFHSKARLRRHMMSHRNKAIACDECGEEFPDGRALVSHRHSHNKDLGGRTFPCRECGKTFGSRSSQQIHIRIHTGERPYGCRFCWKAFADGGTLRKHERIHTGEKPYGCAICPRAFNQRVVLREHVRAHHSGPDPKCHNSITPYVCKVCGDAYSTSEEIVAHIVQHCDDNTAMRRQPQQGPRKYKRRRKLKQEEPIMNQFDFMDGISDNEDTTRRKPVKKTKQYRSNVDEGYQSVLKSFESSIQNINSIVNSSKSYPTNKTNKVGKKRGRQSKEDKLKNENNINNIPTTSQSGRPKMIHTQKTRVLVDNTTEGVKKGQKTKTMVTKTPKVMPNEQKLSGERNRPRTKNVSYHIEGRQQFMHATFPAKLKDGSPRKSKANQEMQQHEPSAIEMINIKLEPDLQRSGLEVDIYANNNGEIENHLLEKSPLPHLSTPPANQRKASPAKRSGRKGRPAAKQKPKEKSNSLGLEQQTEPVSSKNIENAQPTRLFESVVDGSNLEVAFESNAVTTTDMAQESILPDIEKINSNYQILDNDNGNENVSNKEGNDRVNISVKVEPAHNSMLDVQNLLGSVEDVPETIIPDAVEYTCEMCSAVFENRAELLVHVPIHI